VCIGWQPQDPLGTEFAQDLVGGGPDAQPGRLHISIIEVAIGRAGLVVQHRWPHHFQDPGAHDVQRVRHHELPE
jgi:hypothetical protein